MIVREGYFLLEKIIPLKLYQLMTNNAIASRGSDLVKRKKLLLT